CAAVACDARVPLFSLGMLVVSGLLVGFAPAIRLARTDVGVLHNESTRSTSGGKSTGRWLSVMTVVEIAIAIMLVAGAGWLVRGFASLRNTDAGFQPEQRLIFDVAFQLGRYPNGNARRTATNDLMDALRALHAVTAVGATSAYPMRGTLENSLLLQMHGTPSEERHARDSVAQLDARSAVRPEQSDGHAAALREPGALRRDGHETGPGPGFR